MTNHIKRNIINPGFYGKMTTKKGRAPFDEQDLFALVVGFVLGFFLVLLSGCAEVPAEEQLRRALKLRECLEIEAACIEAGRAAGKNSYALLDALQKCADDINEADCARTLYEGVEGITRK